MTQQAKRVFRIANIPEDTLPSTIASFFNLKLDDGMTQVSLLMNEQGRCSGEGYITSLPNKRDAIMAASTRDFMGRRLQVEVVNTAKLENVPIKTLNKDAGPENRGRQGSQPKSAQNPSSLHTGNHQQRDHQSHQDKPSPMTSQRDAFDPDLPGGIQYRYPLIDIGANLTHKQYQRDFADVISKSQAAGVQNIVVTGLNIQSSKEALRLSQTNPGYLYCTVGMHPHNARHFTSASLLELEQLAQQAHCVAIGECGLDFNRNFSPQQMQIDAFEKQVQLACRLGKPLFLHERDSSEAFLHILSKYHAELPPVVVHCFTGKKQDALIYLGLGFYIGVTGFLWKDKTGDGVRSLLYEDEMPLNKLLLETDAPFMFPYFEKGNFPPQVTSTLTKDTMSILRHVDKQRNEPCMMPVIAELVAGCMGRRPQEVAMATTHNAMEFFQLHKS